MATILYPTRAGDTSHLNQDRVIALAREQGAKLVLLYVSNVRFLDHIAGPVKLDLLETELDHLGEFLLAMVQERAEKILPEVESVIRKGDFRQALKEAIQEYDVTAVVLGNPSQDTPITTQEHIAELAQFMLAESSVEVFVVDDGQIVAHYRRPDAENASPAEA